MKKFYQSWKPQAKKRGIALAVNHVLDALPGIEVSVRQVYYQLVTSNQVENTDKSYDVLVDVISRGRKAGMIDWDRFVDRGRVYHHAYVSGPADTYMEKAARGWRKDMWENQRFRLEVVVEKQALEGVLKGACDPYRVTYHSSKGQPSVTTARENFMRIEDNYKKTGQVTIIAYLGDLDPSGLEMSETWDNNRRLFCEDPRCCRIERIALNWDQVEKFGVKPQPTKMKDACAKKFGSDVSFELDGVRPTSIHDLITDFILYYRDEAQWDLDLQEEQDVIAMLLSKL